MSNAKQSKNLSWIEAVDRASDVVDNLFVRARTSLMANHLLSGNAEADARLICEYAHVTGLLLDTAARDKMHQESLDERRKRYEGL